MDEARGVRVENSAVPRRGQQLYHYADGAVKHRNTAVFQVGIGGKRRKLDGDFYNVNVSRIWLSQNIL